MKHIIYTFTALLFLISHNIFAQEVYELDCSGSTVVDFSLAEPWDELDTDEPVVIFEFTASNPWMFFETLYSSPSDLQDTKLTLLKQGTWGRLYIVAENDNAEGSLLGLSRIEAQTVSDETYFVAIAGSNYAGSCILNYSSCNGIRDFSASAARRSMELDTPYDLEGLDSRALIFDGFSTIVFEPLWYDILSFNGTGFENTLQWTGTTAGANINISIFEFSYGNDPSELLTLEDIEANGQVVFSPLEGNLYLLAVWSDSIPSPFESPNAVLSDSTPTLTLSSSGVPVGFGTYDLPWPLDLPIYEARRLGRNTDEYPEAACLEKMICEHFYSFIGDGVDQSINISGGIYRGGSRRNRQLILDNPMHLQIYRKLSPTNIVCVLDESGVFLDEFFSIPTIDGEEYFVKISHEEAVDYSLFIGTIPERAKTLFFEFSQTLECGGSLELEESSTSNNDYLFVDGLPCGTVGAEPDKSAAVYIGDGDATTIQVIGDKVGKLHAFKEVNGQLECLSNPIDIDTSLVSSLTFQTQIGQRFLFVYEEEEELRYNERIYLDAFTQACVPCAGVYSGVDYPAPIENSYIQQVISEIPACCSIGWLPGCNDAFDELILNEITQGAPTISCGVYDYLDNNSEVLSSGSFDLSFAYRPQVFEFSEEYSCNAGRIFRFTGTGSTITVDYTPDPTYEDQFGLYVIQDNDGYEILAEVSSGSVSFELPAGQEAFILIPLITDIVPTYFEFTLTDPNQCGLCDPEFDGTVPVNSSALQGVLGLNPSCCSNWTESCQNVYNTLAFPTCFIAETLTCGDKRTGNTTDGPIYQEYRCDDQPFTASADWYKFMGTGETWVIEVINDFSSQLNSEIFLYSGECPNLECLGGAQDGGQFDDAKMLVPTVDGVEYYFAVTGENGDEGAYEVELRTEDYCGTCKTIYSQEHTYEVSDPIFQAIIAENPSCCESFWDFDCERAYNVLSCSFTSEPNDDLFQATFIESFGGANCGSNISGAIADQADVDFYSVGFNAEGTCFIDLNSLALLPDLNLRVYRDNAVIATSDNEFSSFEFIQLDVTQPGTYQIEVYPASGTDFSMNECYELNLQWEETIPSCLIDVALNDDTSCDPSTNTWNMEIEVISNNTGGSEWLINGVTYPISDQIQVHTLTGLPANGESLDLHIQVKGNPACQALYENFNTAPMSCASVGTACQGDFNEDGQRNATDLLTFLAVFGVACE